MFAFGNPHSDPSPQQLERFTKERRATFGKAVEVARATKMAWWVTLGASALLLGCSGGTEPSATAPGLNKEAGGVGASSPTATGSWSGGAGGAPSNLGTGGTPTSPQSTGAKGGTRSGPEGSERPSGNGGAGETAGAGGTGNETTPPLPSAKGFLHVEGSDLRDSSGNLARFTGVNWFGFETSNQSPHGLWARDYRSMLKQIRALGFNSVRIPWSNQIMRSDAKAASVNTYGADPYDQTDPMNKDLEGKTPLEMLDAVVAAAGDLGLKLILDNHSRESDGYMVEEVWYTDKTSEEQWIADWVAMAQRYHGNPTVAAFDLDNEPHGIATWGAGTPATDWNSAAERCGNAILNVNPDALIIVEGVQKVGTSSYWWGGNLSGVRQAPIRLSRPEKLVYSPHEYGPEVFAQKWFSEPTFPANLPNVWTSQFDFIMKENLGHLFLGEFGLKDPKAAEGKSGQWFDTVLKELAPRYSWTFWCWNPNSGDTEGILQYDWLSPQQWKIDALKPYLAPPIDN